VRDIRLIACNYRQATSVAALGALAYVLPQLGGNLPERVRVVVRSRGGRWVEKWEALRRLHNFRVKTIPPEHPRYRDERLRLADVTGVETDMMSRLAQAGADVVARHRAG
jgi:hypothetical protein